MQATSTPNPLPRWLAWISFLLAAWLLSPALTSTHVEAFSARLQSMAILGARGQFATDDLAYPLNLEYFYTTRGGTVEALEWLMRLTHSSGDLNFRVLTLLGFALFAAACAVFVRRWSDEPVWAVLAALALTPGLCEPAFFFADNLLSAALAAVAFALIGPRRSGLAWAGAGAVLACATLLRIDAILAAPALLLLVLLQERASPLRALGSWALALAGAALVFTLSWRLTSVSLSLSVHVGRLHSALHQSWGDHIPVPRVLLLFFGPTLLLIALGIYHRRQQSWQQSVALVLSPVLFYVAVLPQVVELRDYLLLLAPFLLLYAATGITTLFRLARLGTQRQQRLALAAVALYGLTLIAPPLLILHDGPRLLLGRLYAPILWRRWQHSTQEATGQVKALAASSGPAERTLILSTYFQSDRFLHLALLQAGYGIQPLASTGPCHAVEVYTLGKRTIYHVRTENPYFLLSRPPLSLPAEYVRAYQTATGLSCVPPAAYDRAYLDTWGTTGQGFFAQTRPFLAGVSGAELAFPGRRFPHLGASRMLGVQRLLLLSPADVEQIDSYSQHVIASRPPMSYADFARLAQPLVWTIQK